MVGDGSMKDTWHKERIGFYSGCVLAYPWNQTEVVPQQH